MNISRVLLLGAVLAFVLAIFGVSPFGLSPIALGLALFAASFLV